jgi:hypothetical protein
MLPTSNSVQSHPGKTPFCFMVVMESRRTSRFTHLGPACAPASLTVFPWNDGNRLRSPRAWARPWSGRWRARIVLSRRQFSTLQGTYCAGSTGRFTGFPATSRCRLSGASPWGRYSGTGTCGGCTGIKRRNQIIARVAEIIKIANDAATHACLLMHDTISVTNRPCSEFSAYTTTRWSCRLIFFDRFDHRLAR